MGARRPNGLPIRSINGRSSCAGGKFASLANDVVMTAGNNKYIGQSVLRLEDPPLVRGRGRFAGDISFPHQLHMRMVRSAMAHGRIVSIDARAALAIPGVAAVWTAADIADIPPIDFREGPDREARALSPAGAGADRVRYVGEPVAAVFAADPYVAEDAADLVAIEIEELPVLLDAGAAPGRIRGRALDRSRRSCVRATATSPPC